MSSTTTESTNDNVPESPVDVSAHIERLKSHEKILEERKKQHEEKIAKQQELIRQQYAKTRANQQKTPVMSEKPAESTISEQDLVSVLKNLANHMVRLNGNMESKFENFKKHVDKRFDDLSYRLDLIENHMSASEEIQSKADSDWDKYVQEIGEIQKRHVSREIAHDCTTHTLERGFM